MTVPEGDIALTDSLFTGTSTKDFKTERDVKLSSKLPAELNRKVVLLTPCERVLQLSWVDKTQIGFSRINLLNWRNDEVKIVGDIPLPNKFLSLGKTRACRTRKKKELKCHNRSPWQLHRESQICERLPKVLHLLLFLHLSCSFYICTIYVDEAIIEKLKIRRVNLNI